MKLLIIGDGLEAIFRTSGDSSIVISYTSMRFLIRAGRTSGRAVSPGRVFSVLYEGFGLPPPAMAAGAPVITSISRPAGSGGQCGAAD